MNGMSKVFNFRKGRPQNALQGMIEVNGDADAERVVVLDRQSMTTLHNVVKSKDTVQLRVPLEYGSSNELIVGIVDDDRNFDCEFTDGVQAQLVDGNLVKMSK